MSSNGATIGTVRPILMVAAFIALIATPGAKCSAQPIDDSTRPVRVHLMLDNSGSTSKAVEKRRLIDRELEIGSRWAAALKVPSGITVELLTASDRVDVVGTFVMRSESDRTALVEAISGIEAIRQTRTIFAAVDRSIADIVRRDTRPAEEFSLIYLTDGVSDDPKNDLRAEDIGSRMLELEAGVYAVLLGNVPSVDALNRRGPQQRRAVQKVTVPAARSSAMRSLYGGSIQIDGLPTFEGTVTPLLFGGWNPAQTEIQVQSQVGVDRVVRFESLAPPGVVVEFVPNPVVAPAAGTLTITATLSTQAAVDGDVIVIARLPDGRAQQHTVRVQLTRRSWIRQQAWAASILILAAIMAALAIHRRKQSALRVGHHADTDKQAALAVGDTVPLATFAPGAVGALRRSWLGFQVIADQEPISVGGRLISPGACKRYRLGEEISCGQRTFGIYPIDAALKNVNGNGFHLDASWSNGGGLR